MPKRKYGNEDGVAKQNVVKQERFLLFVAYSINTSAYHIKERMC